MTADNPYESPEKDSRSVPLQVTRPIGIGGYLLIAFVAIGSGCIAFFATCFSLAKIAESGYIGIDLETLLVGSLLAMIVASIFIGLKMYGSLSKGPSESTGDKS